MFKSNVTTDMAQEQKKNSVSKEKFKWIFKDVILFMNCQRISCFLVVIFQEVISGDEHILTSQGLAPKAGAVTLPRLKTSVLRLPAVLLHHGMWSWLNRPLIYIRLNLLLKWKDEIHFASFSLCCHFLLMNLVISPWLRSSHSLPGSEQKPKVLRTQIAYVPSFFFTIYMSSYIKIYLKTFFVLSCSS